MYKYLRPKAGGKLHFYARTYGGDALCGLWRKPMLPVERDTPAPDELLCGNCLAQVSASIRHKIALHVTTLKHFKLSGDS